MRSVEVLHCKTQWRQDRLDLVDCKEFKALLEQRGPRAFRDSKESKAIKDRQVQPDPRAFRGFRAFRESKAFKAFKATRVRKGTRDRRGRLDSKATRVQPGTRVREAFLDRSVRPRL